MQNGELYNHGDAARASSAGAATGSSRARDTEVIPHVYEEAGPAFAERLHGKFGIAVWDRAAPARRARARPPRRQAALLRGRRRPARLRLRAQERARERARRRRARLRGDRRLPDARLRAGAAHAARRRVEAAARPRARRRAAAATASSATGTTPSRAADSPPLRAEEYDEGLLAELEEAVADRLMSDVPLGAMLSGGLDSSLIVALMARNMSEPVKTFAVGFRDEHEVNELADARYVADVLRRRPPRARAVVRRRHGRPREPRLAPRRADRGPLGARLPGGLRAARRGTSPSRCRARAPTSCSAATRSTAPRRSWAPGSGCRGRVTRAGEALGVRGPGALPPRRPHARGAGPAARAIEMSGRLGGGLREALFRGPLEGHDRRVGAAPPRAPPERHAGRPADLDAAHRRPAGARRRHAALLRPRVDGALARGARAVPRPPRRRVLRPDPRRPQGAPAADEAHPQARRDRDRARPDRAQAQARLPARLVGGVARGAAAHRRAEYLLDAAPRYSEFLDRGAVERMLRRPPRRHCDRRRAPADLDPDARAVAAHLPPARARRAAPPARERITLAA